MTEDLHLALPLTLAGLTTAVILARALLVVWRKSAAHLSQRR